MTSDLAMMQIFYRHLTSYYGAMLCLRRNCSKIAVSVALFVPPDGRYFDPNTPELTPKRSKNRVFGSKNHIFGYFRVRPVKAVRPSGCPSRSRVLGERTFFQENRLKTNPIETGAPWPSADLMGNISPLCVASLFIIITHE
jgi:hypothetical protein